MLKSLWVVDSRFWFEGKRLPPKPIPTPVVEPALVYGSTSTEAFALEPGKTKQNSFVPSFWERDFKNSIFIEPAQIELGFISGPSSHDVKVWSSFEQPLTLQSLTANGNSGLNLVSIEGGTTLAPHGGTFRYVLNVSDKVPVRIDAHWRWQFDHAATSLSVNGTKLVIWPYPPIYPVVEQWQWATAIIETRSAEQRLNNADWPVQSLSYRYTHHRDLALSNEMRFAINGDFPLAVPLWLDAIPNVSVQAGATTIAASVGQREFNDSALLYHNEHDYELVNIAAITPSTLELKGQVQRDHRNATLLPIRFAISKDGIKTNRRGLETNQEISFLNTELFTLPASPWPVNYRGIPVLTEYRKQARTRAKFPWKQRRTATNTPVNFLQRDVHRKQVDIELLDHGDRLAFRQRLTAFKGGLNPVWWLSYGHEIRIAALCTRNKLVVERRGFTERWPQGLHLWLEWADGPELVAARPEGLDANGNEILAIDTPNTHPVTDADLTAGHLLYLVRCDDDNWKFKHTKYQSSVTLSLIEVPPTEYPQ
uniref:hypothetical protein n=1 Tax=Thaumasiovibrio occultus TaxID=1891184 RepID=UPI000B35BDA3|nr:hypothetical protein [Thaumasiovibrio occultus]